MAGSVIQMALALLFATLLSFKTKGSKFFRGALYFPCLICGISVGFIFKFFFTHGFVLDTLLSWVGFNVETLPYWLRDESINNIVLVACSLWKYMGQNIVMFIGVIASVDPTLYEAAEIDGANSWHRFKDIILPSISTIVVLNLIISVSGALSAYYRLTGQQAALDRALELFRLIESRCTDAEGYLEAFTVDWKPESNEKLSENGVMADKTMNTLLHVFEGYAGLYQASRDPAVGQAMRRILGIYADKVYSPALHRQLVFFDSHYRSIIDLYSYGHDIESSWLIDWGCALLGDAALTARIGAIDSDLARSVYQHAYRDHSLLNECERGVDDTTRVWWVQAEAVLGFVNEYEKSGGEAYAAAAADIWHYITDKLVDKRPGGEWFWSVDASGVPASRQPIVEPWKCPYHNGRMCMELIRRDPDVTV